MILLVLILVPLLFIAWRAFYEKQWKKELTIRVRFSEKAVYAGNETQLTEEIINRKRLTLPEVEAEFRVPKGIRFIDAENIVISDFVYKRDIFSLRGMEAVRRRYRLECQKRGRYQTSALRARSWSFFHRKKYELEIDDSDELFVYAGHADVSRITAMCNTLQGEIESRKSLLEDPFTFSGIREYQPFDPMKQINWKATARTGELMVNTFGSVRSEQFMVFLDIMDERILKEEELTEHGIRAAASLIRKVIRGGMAAGLAVNTDPPFVLEPERGQDQLRRIELFLTGDFSDTKTIPFEMLPGFYEKEQEDEICIYISKEPVSSLTVTSMFDRNRSLSQDSFPAVLVTPVYEEGKFDLQVQKVRR